MIRVTNHIWSVHAILQKFGIPIESLCVVPCVHGWCRSQGIAETNPFRAAKCFVGPDRCLIVIRDEQTDAMIRSAKSNMEWLGFEAEVRQLDSDARYLEHLVLHEIAFFVLRNADQTARDRWAFDQMALHD